MRGKLGWIRILEATVAVLIVSGAIIAVYSNHPSRGESIEEQAYSLQRQILDEVAMDEGLRLAVLNVETDLPGDTNYDELDEYVAESIPDGFGYLLRICLMGDERDFCKMDKMTFSATKDYDIFVEDVLISAEIGNGSGEEVYLPKKVRLFFWEGGWPEGFCRDECAIGGHILGCSADLTRVVNRSCVYNVTSGCNYYDNPADVESCETYEFCVNGACEESEYKIWRCEMRTVMVDDWTDSRSNIPYLCAAYDDWAWIGSIECPWYNSDCDDRHYQCYNIDEEETACEVDPACSNGYTLAEAIACIS
ncbi:hypothetical protein K8R30_03175 [archaeon]|nr:hypothetical protein [archaeon]